MLRFWKVPEGSKLGTRRFLKVLEGSAGRFWNFLEGFGRFGGVLEGSRRYWEVLEFSRRFWKVPAESRI